jgi:hypothetical protein
MLLEKNRERVKKFCRNRGKIKTAAYLDNEVRHLENREWFKAVEIVVVSEIKKGEAVYKCDACIIPMSSMKGQGFELTVAINHGSNCKSIVTVSEVVSVFKIHGNVVYRPIVCHVHLALARLALETCCFPSPRDSDFDAMNFNYWVPSSQY